MNSSFYSRLDTALKNSLKSLVILEPLSIVSIEYSVLREKGQKPLLHIELLLCEAEQKERSTPHNHENDVETDRF